MALTLGITGALGFIGRTMAERFAADGHRLVGLDLGDDGGYYASLGGRYVRGDITDRAAAAAFAQGCDRVYHTAAIVKESGDWALFDKINVEGPRIVAEAAREAGVKEFVHFSSVMVYGFDFPDGVAESGPLDGADNPYCTSKIRSETAVLAYHDPGRFDVYVIRPGDVYGPASVPWTVRPVEMMKRRAWTFVDSRTSIFNHVYVDNLIDGIELVTAKKASGRPFVITDDARTTVREFFGHYQRWLGIGFLPEVPAWLALPAGSLLEAAGGLVGVAPEVNRQAVRYMIRKGKYSCEAVKALGYRPAVDLAEGMARTRRWLERHGMLD